MLIPLQKLIQKHNLQIRGIIHVGGSHAEEAESYLQNGIQRQLWVEAIPEVFEKMLHVINPNPMAIGVNACVSDKPFQRVTLNVTNNSGQSSSILQLKKHKDFYPTIVVERTIDCTTLTLDDIASKDNVNAYYNLKNYNFLNLDIQGAELMALKGFATGLKDIDYIYCEVNEAELYEGCALVNQIDEYLADYGFVGADCIMTDAQWGDKFYIKQK